MPNRYVVIMAGGRGERFWPESRLARPKQLLPIVGDAPMLRQTLDRLKGLIPLENCFIITNREQLDAVRAICSDLDPAKLIGEPVGRDTAAAVSLATLLVEREDPDATFAILPADAVIHDDAGFRATLEASFLAAENKPMIITVGIKPSHPATGYGYIRQGEALDRFANQSLIAVSQFVEKPDLETARQYLADGSYCWNAGMFIWQVATIKRALQAHTPSLWQSMQGIANELDQGQALEDSLDRYYPDLQKISIDYAVIEKAKDVAMIEAAFDWDDVGEWPAVARHYPADADGNVVRGDAHLKGASDNIVYSRSEGHLIGLLGVKDLIVVHTPDATLICHKDAAQDIKQMVKDLSAQPGRDHLL
jgi:mannose-1-phosphate guanylyltransferase